MTARLGNALFVLSLVAAGAWVAMNFAAGQQDMLMASLLAAPVALIGFAIRYVLAGGKAERS